MSPDDKQDAIDIIVSEGMYLDDKDWDAWLALYTEDSEYWMPAWDDEFTMTTDPDTQLSLIYYGSRAGLEDRIYRIRTELSLASSPLPRTCHMTSNFHIEKNESNELLVRSAWTTHSYRLKVSHSFYGHQTHTLCNTDEGLKISKRHIVLQNDSIPNVLDIYSV